MTIIPDPSGKPHPLIIFGAGGQAKDTISFLLDLPDDQNRLVGVLDDDPGKKGGQVMGYPILGGREWLTTAKEKPDIFLAPGDPATRRRLSEELRPFARAFPSLVHPKAIINLKHTTIGEGCFIAPGTIVTSGAGIGRFVFLHAASTINHDSVVKDFCMLSTGVNLGGTTTLEEEVFMGINSSTLPGVTVGKGVMVGGGTVCTKDVPPNCIIAGVPGRVLRQKP